MSLHEQSAVIHLPVLFGLEACTRDELYALGFESGQVTVSDGLVLLRLASEDLAKDAVATLNFRLRTAERVLYEVASFDATTFDDLFFQAEALPWERWLDLGFEILVNGYSRQSALFGVPSIQRTLKKAIVNRLLTARGNKNGRVREDRRTGQIEVRFALVNNRATLLLDTSGEGLHKRGYRPLRHEAPLRETLAAAILHYSFFLRNQAKGEGLFDPMCGSGTFPIEAALMLKNEAPGLHRHFAAERMQFFGVSRFDRAREFAKSAIVEAPAGFLFGSDISGDAIRQAKDNAKRAGVADLITFHRGDMTDLTVERMKEITGLSRLLLVANPPYGERLTTPEHAGRLVEALGRLAGRRGGREYDGLRVSVLSPHERFEMLFGAKADKRRKLYNGMIRCTLYHYFR